LKLGLFNVNGAFEALRDPERHAKIVVSFEDAGERH